MRYFAIILVLLSGCAGRTRIIRKLEPPPLVKSYHEEGNVIEPKAPHSRRGNPPGDHAQHGGDNE